MKDESNQESTTLNLSASSFGQPISRQEADGLFLSLHTLKTNSEVKKSLQTIKDQNVKKTALEYFAGDIYGFMFTIDALKDIFKTLGENSNRSLVMFSGIRNDPGQLIPTLIGFVYEQNDSLYKIVEKNIDSKDGVEHPGRIHVTEANIPTTIPASDIVKLKLI